MDLVGKMINFGDYLVYDFHLSNQALKKADDGFYKKLKANPNYGKLNYESRYDCTYWSLDLVFDNGSKLSDSMSDQNGISLKVDDQYNSKTLFADQDNYKIVDLSNFAGKKIVEVTMTYPLEINVKIDDIFELDQYIGSKINYIDTRRGTNNAFEFSRGNTFPVVAEPHGCIFGMPFTDKPGSNRPYTYSSNKIYGFGISRIPSPW
ncbi:MAG: hypothetical protein LBT99_00005, partial [Bifidobacteriaceae bacterium]|nr:hypothetical protein [Bifidobacteriaceae bacterium]